MNVKFIAASLLLCAATWIGGPARGLAGQPVEVPAERPKVPPAGHHWKQCKMVNQWWKEGTCAGNVGDWYDNRDGGHSPLRIAKYFPQMKKISSAGKGRRGHWGLARRLYPNVTIGNSSTSAQPLRGGSNPRHCYVSGRGVSFLYQQYRGNNLFVYPEHRDYDPGHNQRQGFGDLYPTNTPYLIISQGSSGSDLAFLRAMAHTLASFRVDVKKKLIDEKLLMPTLQQIFRTSNKMVAKPEDYLTGKAHPTVFSGRRIDEIKMITAAHDMKIETIPPMIQLEVVSESFSAGGRGVRSEKLADTPAVIARVHRTPDYRKKIVVSAKKSFDMNKKPLKYHWAVLHGDEKKIEIKTREGGAVAEITVPYHDRRPVVPGSKMEGTRVDIGVFVHNGTSYSAPGFVTVFYLDTEARTYDEKGRLLDIYRAAGDTTIGRPGSYPSQLISDRYDIRDWPALFALLKKDAQGFAAALLRKQLKPDALAVIAKAADVFKPEDMKKLASKDKAIRKEQRTIRDRLGKALTAKDPALKASAKDLAESALNAIRSDHNLYFANAKEIDALAAACADQKAKAAFLAAKAKIAAIGIFKGGKLASIFPGHKGLTKYEAYQVKLLNLTIMKNLLYSKFLTFSGSKNYVDHRVGRPSPWRDVYRCDASGRIVGWTRYDDGAPGKYVVKERH